MRSRLLFIASAAACLIGGNLAFAEEVVTDNGKTASTQTNITSGSAVGPGESAGNASVKPSLRGGGNVEWRRSDHGASNPSRSSGPAGGNRSDSSGGGSDGGGGGGGSTD
jgi:hypothetical protein